jgi:hypothetical protein
MQGLNIIELDQGVSGNPRWVEFAEKLKEAIDQEYRLEGLTVVLREMTTEEAVDGEKDLLTFSQAKQRFEFALPHGSNFPPAWEIADRIDSFLNPDAGGDG